LRDDPGETHDLSRALPAVEAELRGALEQWRASLAATGGTSATVPPEKLRAHSGMWNRTGLLYVKCVLSKVSTVHTGHVNLLERVVLVSKGAGGDLSP